MGCHAAQPQSPKCQRVQSKRYGLETSSISKIIDACRRSTILFKDGAGWSVMLRVQRYPVTISFLKSAPDTPGAQRSTPNDVCRSVHVELRNPERVTIKPKSRTYLAVPVGHVNQRRQQLEHLVDPSLRPGMNESCMDGAQHYKQQISIR